ncbi:Beta-peptidyl aminopeptidase BapA [subsurface metagenome]
MTEPDAIKRNRARDIGIKIGRLQPGEYNAITDIPGVKVGHSTIIKGKSEKNKTKGIVRTGVTVIHTHDKMWQEPVYAGCHVINGNGELTGISLINDSGLLTTPIAITNTNSVGIVRDAMITYFHSKYPEEPPKWILPVVGETWDGWLSDPKNMNISEEDVFKAIESAKSGAVEEGNVGGGTGMICHEFKGGIGTSSRKIKIDGKTYTVGVLVQSNYGLRYQLRINGVPIGIEITLDEVQGITKENELIHSDIGPSEERGSIIIVAATDVPLLPVQCKRLAKRTALGLARVGSISADISGDIAIAFSTGKKINPKEVFYNVRVCGNSIISDLFEAVVESTEEAILNSLCAAETMSGIEGRTIYSLPLNRTKDILRKYNR